MIKKTKVLPIFLIVISLICSGCELDNQSAVENNSEYENNIDENELSINTINKSIVTVVNTLTNIINPGESLNIIKKKNEQYILKPGFHAKKGSNFSITDHPRGIALLICLSKYDDSESANDRIGAENDLDIMKDLFTAHGYDLVVLENKNATKKNIINEIQKASERLKSGDYFVFAFAGHGSQKADDNGDET